MLSIGPWGCVISGASNCVAPKNFLVLPKSADFNPQVRTGMLAVPPMYESYVNRRVLKTMRGGGCLPGVPQDDPFGPVHTLSCADQHGNTAQPSSCEYRKAMSVVTLMIILRPASGGRIFARGRQRVSGSDVALLEYGELCRRAYVRRGCSSQFLGVCARMQLALTTVFRSPFRRSLRGSS